MLQLLIGPNEKEKIDGFLTSIPEKVEIKKIEMRDGLVMVDFNQALQEGVAGSCKISSIRAQITETLKQFTEVKEVIISIEGNNKDIF